jgi:fructosamine-3-kinase
LGLQWLAAQNILLVSQVLGLYTEEDQQFLLLDWIETGERTPLFWKKFGEKLAQLHQVKTERFGWETDNYMGSVPQQNTWTDDWVSFFSHHRLQPLLLKCNQQKLLTNNHLHLFDQLIEKLTNIFDEAERPSLVHGDLWSGNFMCNQQSKPVLIDPAIYYGHPSVDLGMTTLFGGFAKEFYDAYRFHYALPHNYQEQWQVCNLYPLLIHLLLFGKPYLAQIENTLASFA